MNDTPQGGSAPDGGLDLAGLLGTSGQPETTNGSIGDVIAPAQGQQTQPGGTAFKFANRTWDSQQKAEEHFNKIYGKYTEHQGLLNKLKEALKDPEDIAELAKDPAWADILAKLGIEAATESVDARLQDEASTRPQTFAEVEQRIATREAMFDLRMERWEFEQTLGRKLAKDEQNAILDILGGSPSLTYEQAYNLAFHDKILKDVREKAMQTARPKTGRPAPPPSLVSGQKLDLKKPVAQMSKEEAREAMREDIRAGMRG